MRRAIIAVAVVAGLIATNAFCGAKPLDPESNWAVIVGALSSNAESANLETALRRLAAMLRSDYDLRAERVIEVFGDVGPRTLSSVFGRISRERGMRTTVLVYLATRITSARYESGREIYLVPREANEKETWRLTPLSGVLRLLPRDAAVIVIFADCLDEESRYSKYIFDVSPTEMPRVNFLTMCPRTLDLLYPTGRVFTALRDFRGSKLTLRELYDRLQSAQQPNSRVFMVQDPIGNGPPFELAHRSVDRWQSYVTALQTAATPERKLVALEDLVKAISSEANVPPSSRAGATRAVRNIATSGNETETVRYAAINAVSRLVLDEAAPDLIRIVSSPNEDPTLRVAAIAALDKLTVPDRAAYIEKALGDADARVRVAAIRSAKNAKEERFAEAIAARIQRDDNDDVRIAALQAVSDFTTKGDVIRSAVRWALENGPTPAIRSEAVLTWGRLQQPLTDSVIDTMLRNDPDKSVRETIALSLGRFQFDPQQLADVEKMLDAAADPGMPPEVRRAAMTSWRRIGGDHSVAALIKGLSDPDDSVKLAAIGGLTSSSKAAVPALKSLAGGSSSVELRRNAIAALGDIGDPDAGDVLRAALKDEDSSVRDEAVKAIQKINAELSEGELLEQLADPSPAVRGLALTRVTAQHATIAVTDRIIQLLGDPDLSVRQSAIATLSRLNSSDALDRLQQALEKGEFLQRASAAEALGAIGNPQVAAALRKQVFDPNPLVRSAVVKALSRLPTRSEDIGLFLASGRDPDIAVRLASVEALEKIPSERSRAMLKVLANDEASAVRVAAAEALSRAQ